MRKPLKRINLTDLCDNCGTIPVKPLRVATTEGRTFLYCSKECRTQKWIGAETWPNGDVNIIDRR